MCALVTGLGVRSDRLSPLDAHLIKGKPQQIFNTPWGQATVGICYESAFAEHFRRQTLAGGELEFIITVSNDAHYRWISGVNTYELHTATIYQRQNKTLYVRWGDWLTIILLICGALSFFCV